MDKLIEAIQENGILIGSRAWGGYTKNSDYDYVFDEEIMYLLLKFFEKKQIEIQYLTGNSDNQQEHAMFNIANVKVRLNDGIYNLMSYEKEDIPKVESLDAAMRALINTQIGKMCVDNKKIRIEIVQAFLRVLFIRNDFDKERLEGDVDADITETEINRIFKQ